MDAERTYETWCRRIKHSDQQAYEELFRAQHGALYRYAHSIVKDDTAARDIVQEVFLQLWEMRTSLDPSRSLKALLYRMVRNKSYNHQRNRRTREDLLREQPRPLAQDDPVLPDRVLSARRLDARLQRWIAELPDRQREALELSRYEGLSHQEIAEVMEISPRTVNNHLVRALKTLRDHIHRFEPDLLKQ